MTLRLIFAMASLVLLACSEPSGAAEEPRAVAVAPPPAPADPTLAKTVEGDLRGALDGETRVFKGVPFAAPPVGSLRWRPPAPVASWNGERVATSYARGCTQRNYPRGRVIGSEDCLYLNVWAPRASSLPGAALPVLFWMHGGDNVVGSASDPIYDGRQLAERANAVVVTINYRLGAFGFLAHPAFATENAEHATGDYGLLDAIAALQWVQRNVGALGGDASRVLVFGQSAGASNTCALIASPLAKGLFSRAMMMSLSCHVLPQELVDATNVSAERHLGCEGAGDVPGCLRAKNAGDVAMLPNASLIATDEVVDYYVTLDTWILPEHPESVMAKGKHNRMPMILGTTRDEYQSVIDLILTGPTTTTEAQYRATVEAWYGAVVAELLLPVYPFSAYPSGRDALVAIISDEVMHCPTRRAARAATTGQHEPVYRYLFSRAPSAGPAAAYGAAHGVDVDYVFRTFTGVDRNADDEAVADALIGSIGRFAATGDPNVAGDSAWPRYDVATDPYAVLDVKPTVASGVHSAACDLWDELSR